jgi:hypothetical protein
MIKPPKFDSQKEKYPDKSTIEQLPKEEVSTLAMVVTEAIYKFIRRN